MIFIDFEFFLYFCYFFVFFRSFFMIDHRAEGLFAGGSGGTAAPPGNFFSGLRYFVLQCFDRFLIDCLANFLIDFLIDSLVDFLIDLWNDFWDKFWVDSWVPALRKCTSAG